MRVLKVLSVTLIVLMLAGSSGYLFFKNRDLNKSYEAATQQVTELQSKLDAIGTFTDVYTIKASVKMGQEIKEDDLILQTVPTSTVPANVVTDKGSLVGNYYRIGLEPGITLTSDFISVEEYEGSVYERDVFLDSLPVGTQVGDYIDIRVVLPGGEEFVVFSHKRVNARYENAVKMKFDEAQLWLYTSMMVDKSIYKEYGMKIYATKYVDPGAHDKTIAYYPVRKEVMDIANVNRNLSTKQKKNMYNENLRNSIDAKLKYYSDELNEDSSKIASGWSDEESRYNQAEQYYQSILETLGEESANNDGDALIDPTEDNTNNGDENLGNISGETPSTDGQTDSLGNGNVVDSETIDESIGDNLFDDESPIE